MGQRLCVLCFEICTPEGRGFRKGRECKFQNKALRAFDPKNNFSLVYSTCILYLYTLHGWAPYQAVKRPHVVQVGPGRSQCSHTHQLQLQNVSCSEVCVEADCATCPMCAGGPLKPFPSAPAPPWRIYTLCRCARSTKFWHSRKKKGNGTKSLQPAAFDLGCFLRMKKSMSVITDKLTSHLPADRLLAGYQLPSSFLIKLDNFPYF